MIRIVNLRNYKATANETLIRVDRSTVVGNPFPMHAETQRNEVCDKYEAYFNNIIAHPEDNKEFMDYLRNIYRVAKQTDVALGCWCAPKRCHAETIKAFIEKFN